MHIAQKFEILLEMFRHPDGRRWSGQEIDEATGGVVTCSYVTNLRKGRIESPGYEKMRAIAKAMGFPPELWFEEDLGSGGGSPAQPEGTGIPGRWSISSRWSRTLRQASPTPTRKWSA
jgi:transcriptional regulator with XRE-family HTH domain